MASTPTTPASSALDAALAKIPTRLRGLVIARYRGLKEAFIDGQHDACGLRAGRFAEVVLRVLQNALTQTFTPIGAKGVDFDSQCRRLIALPKTAGPESLRVIVPRCIAFLYTLRNKRGMGHESDDLDANEIDAAVCVRLADWTVCELMRHFHAMSLEDGQQLLDSIAQRQIPAVWHVLGRRRVLDTTLNAKDATLLLLHGSPESAALAEDLCEEIEYSSLRDYKRNVLIPLHKLRLIEFDAAPSVVVLSPTGIREVESRIIPKMSPNEGWHG